MQTIGSKSDSQPLLYPRDELEEFVDERRWAERGDGERTPIRYNNDMAYSSETECNFLRKSSHHTDQSYPSSLSQPSFNESLHQSGDRLDYSETVHLIRNSSYARTSSDDEANDDVSFCSDSTFTPSDGESSYFSAKRAIMENPHYNYQPWESTNLKVTPNPTVFYL